MPAKRIIRAILHKAMWFKKITQFIHWLSASEVLDSPTVEEPTTKTPFGFFRWLLVSEPMDRLEQEQPEGRPGILHWLISTEKLDQLEQDERNEKIKGPSFIGWFFQPEKMPDQEEGREENKEVERPGLFRWLFQPEKMPDSQEEERGENS